MSLTWTVSGHLEPGGIVGLFKAQAREGETGWQEDVAAALDRWVPRQSQKASRCVRLSGRDAVPGQIYGSVVYIHRTELPICLGTRVSASMGI